MQSLTDAVHIGCLSWDWWRGRGNSTLSGFKVGYKRVGIVGRCVAYGHPVCQRCWFLLALVSIWIVNPAGFSEEMRLLITTGFFGAFTTVSTSANESVSRLQMGEITTGIAYIALTKFLCLLAVMLALWLANRSII